jgi:hypothetical protein
MKEGKMLNVKHTPVYAVKMADGSYCQTMGIPLLMVFASEEDAQCYADDCLIGATVCEAVLSTGRAAAYREAKEMTR